jgi:hypothetical protein
VGKSKGKRPIGIPISREVDNINMDLIGIEWGDMNCIRLRIGTSGGLL